MFIEIVMSLEHLYFMFYALSFVHFYRQSDNSLAIFFLQAVTSSTTFFYAMYVLSYSPLFSFFSSTIYYLSFRII